MDNNNNDRRVGWDQTKFGQQFQIMGTVPGLVNPV